MPERTNKYAPMFSEIQACAVAEKAEKVGQIYACAVQPVLGQSKLASGTGPEPLPNEGFSWNQELLAGEILL